MNILYKSSSSSLLSSGRINSVGFSWIEIGTYTDLWTTSFIESAGVTCSDFVKHNRIQVQNKYSVSLTNVIYKKSWQIIYIYIYIRGAFKKVPDFFCADITYLGCSVESTEKDIETRLSKAWTAINRLSIIWKSDLTDKMKRSFFQAAVTSILLYGCTTWTLTKRLEKKLDGNYTRMLRAILNKSWQQHPTRHQLYGHLPPITKTIQVRRTRHAGHCWRSRDELIRDVLLWIPTHGRAKAGRPARTYIQQLCEDT